MPMSGAGRLVILCGAKGGVGTTAVAANLAAALAGKGEVLLAPIPGETAQDLGFWFAAPDGGGERGSLRETAASGVPELLDAVAAEVGGGIRLLRGEGRLEPAEIRALLRMALARFSWVVVDAGDGRGGDNGVMKAAAGDAAVILVVRDGDPVAVRRARVKADELSGCGRPVRLVVNRAAGNGRSARPEGAGAEGEIPLLGTISEGREVAESILKGVPVVRAEPRSACAADFARLAEAVSGFAAPGVPETAPADEAAFRAPAFRQLKRRLHRVFLDRVRERGEGAAEGPEEVRRELARLLEGEGLPDLTPGFRARLLKELADEVLGLGPLQDLLDDPEVTEVMVNGAAAVYTERRGRISREPRELDGEEELRAIIERIVAPLGRRIDESSPLVDARLPDGSRVNAVIPPLALRGACLTIRKFAKKRLTLDDLVSGGSLTSEAADFLRAAVSGRLNILISGGTGSGKTTFLNIVASFIGEDERIVTIEDAAELKLPQEHVVTLEARPPNLEGRGAVTIRDLVRNALRMRPDRIVVGECRGGEALDMLQAMNTGHDGSLSTLHANTPRDALSRLETMVLMAGMELPLRAIREQVASAVDLVVQIARMRDGSRRITHITEVGRLEGEVYVMQDIFIRRGEGELVSAGLVPRVAEKLAERGYQLPSLMFQG